VCRIVKRLLRSKAFRRTYREFVEYAFQLVYFSVLNKLSLNKKRTEVSKLVKKISKLLEN